MQLKVNVPVYHHEGEKRVDLSIVAGHLAKLPQHVVEQLLAFLLHRAALDLETRYRRGQYFAAHLLLHDLTHQGMVDVQIQLNEIER